MLETANLTKRFNDQAAVDNLTLKVGAGEIFALLGPNGAGKTTTLRMLLGQSPRTSGALSVFGESIESNLREIRQRTGIVPQADNLDPDFTVSENLRIYGLYFRITSSVLEQRIPKLLKLVELDHRAKDRISTLSGGMKRRLILARALINDPDLLVFDEPTTGLHFQDIRLLLSCLNRLVDQGNTVLVIEHNLDVIKTADHVIDLGPKGGQEGGQVIATGAPENLVKIVESKTGSVLKEVLASGRQNAYASQ